MDSHLHGIDNVADLQYRVACKIAPVLRHGEARLLEAVAQRGHLHDDKQDA